MPLAARVSVKRIEITGLAQHAPLALWKATVYDSITRTSHPLARSQRGLLAELAPERWRQVFDHDGVFIFENARSNRALGWSPKLKPLTGKKRYGELAEREPASSIRAASR